MKMIATGLRFGAGAITRRTRAVFLCSLAPCFAQPALAGGPSPFSEEAVARGVNYTVAQPFVFGFSRIGIGAMFADLDIDGDPDLVLVGAQSGAIRVYENDGTGNFIDRSATSGIPAMTKSASITGADYDGDGDIDIFIGNMFAQNVLYRNDGDFTFTDVTAIAGVGGSTPNGATTGCAWADFDGDGWVDLYVANYYGLTQTGRGGAGGTALEDNHLYRNLGDGTFEDVGAALAVDDPGSPTLQAVFFDHNLNGQPDLYLSTDHGYSIGQQNYLFENQNGIFVDITATAGVAANYDSMGVAIGDFDANGLQDLYPTNIPAGTDLYLNQGGGFFTESADFCGVRSFRTGWAAHFFDYNNNGHQDLYVCNSFGQSPQDSQNRLYVNYGAFPVFDEAPSLNVLADGLSYGLAVADVDGDGDLDLLVPNLGQQIKLYINNEGQKRDWIKFNTVGQGANTHAIGAVVTVTTGATERLREVFAGGNSYKSQNELPLHFGLDNATVTDQIDVLWTGGTTRTLTGYPTNQTWSLYPPERLGDADGDGQVLLDDFFEFVAAYNAPAFQPGMEVMDLNGDAVVDCADANLFFTAYTGPDSDCDGNGVSDLREILNDPAIDNNADGMIDDCQPAVAADINADCVVDTADLGQLIGVFGASGPVGDLNFDCVVDTADLGILIGQFGATCP